MAAWRNYWHELTAFFRYPVELRRIIYTMNVMESLHSQISKNSASRKAFPNDECVIRVMFLDIRNFTNRWTRCQGWDMVVSQLLVLFEDRLTAHLISLMYLGSATYTVSATACA